MENNFKYLLVIGGNGVLGSSIVKVFKSNTQNWRIGVIDYIENIEADKNIIIEKTEKFNENLIKRITNQIEDFSKVYHGVINVAEKWTRGSVKSLEIFDEMEEMMNINFYSSLVASHLTAKYLTEGGICVLTGAAKVFKDTSTDMLAYSIAKTAAHALSWSLKDSSDLPSNSVVITILPEIIDTPENRVNMPLEDFSKWTKPEGIAALIKMWADGFNRPKSGAFVLLKNKDGYVIPEFV